MSVPLLVCHGTADTRIDCSHSRAVARQTPDKPDFSYVEFGGASHSFRPEAQHWPRLASVIAEWVVADPARGSTADAPDDEREYSLA